MSVSLPLGHVWQYVPVVAIKQRIYLASPFSKGQLAFDVGFQSFPIIAWSSVSDKLTEPTHGIKFPELKQVWKYTRLGSLVGNSMIGPHQ
jgi:hypothetical protein